MPHVHMKRAHETRALGAWGYGPGLSSTTPHDPYTTTLPVPPGGGRAAAMQRLYPLHRPYCHEQALRILLAAIESHANRYKRHIVPLLSLSIDFYIRVFVRIYSSPLAVKESACKLAYVWQSSGCDSFWLQRVGQKKQSGSNIKYMPAHGPTVPEIRCPDSGSAYIMGGPMWVEPLHDPQFVAGLLTDIQADRANYAQHAKIKGYLTSVAEELHDVPLYYDLHDLCKTVRCQPPKSEVFRSALLNAGFSALLDQRPPRENQGPQQLRRHHPGQATHPGGQLCPGAGCGAEGRSSTLCAEPCALGAQA
ncbi:tRNA (guanine(26)-N(2))-dimethyltransferase, partial [Haematococcus lacustris]